ncbi:hypothetical protein [Mesorhizobium sp.]|uniref:hypothetical protein n=1 Tax=Mesorhizobium sp. TaxID=1871066 RepID=UPI0025D8467D|nr:hypothetical protein [Mesorhizobium sp.]
MDVLLAVLREGYSAMPLMIRRLGARNPARPARRLRYLTAMFVLIAGSLVVGIALFLAGPAQAQAPATVPPERVKQLFELLDDPSVKAWVAEQRNQDAGSTAAPAAAGASPADASSDAAAAPGQMNTMASSTLDRIKHHIERIVRTLPSLPGQFARVREATMEDMSSRGPAGVLMLIAIFIAADVQADASISPLDYRAIEGYADRAGQEDWWPPALFQPADRLVRAGQRWRVHAVRLANAHP